MGDSQCVLKAAVLGHTEIKLRETVEVNKPRGAPAWMKDKIWKPQVKKLCVEKLELQAGLLSLPAHFLLSITYVPLVMIVSIVIVLV